MADSDDDSYTTQRGRRPTKAQVAALVDYIQQYPDLGNKQFNSGMTRQKVKRKWITIANRLNKLGGLKKSTQGWIKFWSDKKFNVLIKHKQIEEGKLQDKELSPLEERIFVLSSSVTDKGHPTRKRKSLQVEPCTEDDEDCMDEMFPEDNKLNLNTLTSRISTDSEERQFTVMEKLVYVMDQQAQAMSQIAQASVNNSKALERLAEASHIQALAVDRVASTFENINTSVQDVRNAIMSIDYTMKRCYPATATQQRQNSNLFS